MINGNVGIADFVFTYNHKIRGKLQHIRRFYQYYIKHSDTT